jgi:ribonuclease HI
VTTYQSGPTIKIDGKGQDIQLDIPHKTLWYTTCAIKIQGEIEDIQYSLTTHPIVMMSDGSYREVRSGAAWIITTEYLYDKGCYIYGLGAIRDKECDSHRAECYGILGGLKTWMNLQKQLVLQQNLHVLVCCDNASAISFTGDGLRYREITSKVPDFDILQSIRKLTPQGNFSYKHVKGHQDKDGNTLDFLAILNIHVDKLARKASEEDLPQLEDIIIDGEDWDAYIGGKNW